MKQKNTIKIDLNKVNRWLEKVWAKEKEESDKIWKDWPVPGMGSSSKFLEENRDALGKKKRIGSRGGVWNDDTTS